jgi:hypothetical protein
MAFWASCSVDDPGVVEKVKLLNAGCSVDNEVIKSATIKDNGTLTKEDFMTFNGWLKDEDNINMKRVIAQLTSLRHRRWAAWHLFCPDNPFVDKESSMTPPCHSSSLCVCL